MNIRHHLVVSGLCLLGGLPTASRAELIGTVLDSLNNGEYVLVDAGQVELSISPYTLDFSRDSTYGGNSGFLLPSAIISNGLEYTVNQSLSVSGMSGYPEAAYIDLTLHDLIFAAEPNWKIKSFTVTMTGRAGNNAWGTVDYVSYIDGAVFSQGLQGSAANGTAFNVTQTVQNQQWPERLIISGLSQEFYTSADYRTTCRNDNDYIVYGFCTSNIVKSGIAWVNIDKLRIQAQMVPIQTAVPEPESWGLGAISVLVLAGLSKSRRRRN